MSHKEKEQEAIPEFIQRPNRWLTKENTGGENPSELILVC